MIGCGIPDHYPNSDGICINGGVYYEAWVNSSVSAIVCFDVRLEKYRVINAAEGMDLSRATLVNYKGKLGVRTGNCTGNCRHYELWVLEDAETHEWSKNVSVLPVPLWKSVVGNATLYFVGVAGGNDEVVLWPQRVYAPFCVYYYNMERNTFRRVEIKGMDAAVRYYGGCMTLDYVEDVKLMKYV
uniref:Putative F-box protein n=1 Tax=Noccaea caerulescens TaxID=107243 RepID=A0A1J3HZ66_NOCCA